MGKLRLSILGAILLALGAWHPVITLSVVACAPLILLGIAESLVRRGTGYLRTAVVRDRRTGEIFTLQYRIKFNHVWPKLTPWHEDAVTYRPLFSEIPVIMVAGPWAPPRLLGHELGHVEQYFRRGLRFDWDYEIELLLIGYRLSTHEAGANQFRDFVLIQFPAQIPGLELHDDGVLQVLAWGQLDKSYWYPGDPPAAPKVAA